MKVYGLSGGISCGKSAASRYLSESGIPVIDCDVIAKAVVVKGAWGYRRLKKAFRGEDVFLPDGSVDRQKLGAVIFKDAQARRRLNAATHLPVMVSIARQLVSNWLRCKTLVIVDMPLLFEIGAWRYTSGNVVVSCSQAKQCSYHQGISNCDVNKEQVKTRHGCRCRQLARLQERDQVSSELAQQKIDAQLPTAKKVELADYMLDNEGSLEALKRDAEALSQRLKRASKWHGWLLSPLAAGLVALLAFLCNRL